MPFIARCIAIAHATARRASSAASIGAPKMTRIASPMNSSIVPSCLPACRAILRRRRPDVVYGGGGFVAGPVVLAAASLRIPAAIAEADAHLGLSNRLALPFAKRVFLAYPLRGGAARVSASSAARSRARARTMPQAEAREIFELPDRSAGAARRRGPRRSALDQRARGRIVRRGRPAILHISGERDFPSLEGGCSAPTTA